MQILIFPRAKVYPPFGSCIYCGTSNGKLTKEHIIPYALEGDLVLPEAVCEKCQNITGWAEEMCLRGTFGVSRAAAGVRTRNRKARASSFDVGVHDGDPNELPQNMEDVNFRWKPISLEEHPAPILLPVCPTATLFSGLPCSEGLTLEGLQAHVFKYRDPAQPDGSEIAMVPFHTGAFPRMLAKIAHGLAIAELGPDAFEPYLPEYIIGGREDYSRVMGSTKTGRFLRDRLVYASLHHRGKFITARIQLFAKFLRVPYEVVVGRSCNLLGYSYATQTAPLRAW